jgi:diguanylate cyclase (GGDEF)-like protein
MKKMRQVGVALLALVMASSVAPIGLLVHHPGDALLGSPWWWVAIVAAFVAAEHFAINIPLRRSAHSLPLDELPFAIGLVVLPPIGLLAARLVGSALGLLADRGTTMPRRAFGLSQYGASAALGIYVAHTIAPLRGEFGPAQWVAVGAGAMSASAAGLLAVMAAISLTEGRPRPADLLHEMISSASVTIVNVSVAVIGTFVAMADVRALILLAPIAFFSIVGYHAYVNAHRHRSQLELVTELLRGAALAEGPEEALAGLLQRTAAELHSSTATTILLSADGETPSWRVVAAHGDVAVTALHVSDADLFRRQLRNSREQAFAALADTDTVGPSLVARLDGEQGVVGLLAVSGRHDSAGPFTRSDQTLLEAVALQAGAVIERTRVERMLSVASARHDQLLYEANHDPLTKLANRRLFVAALDQRSTDDSPTSVLLIDLDGFKPINDEYGHTIGDELLCRVAERLREVTRADDVVARLGGDEFAVLRHAGVPMTEWRAFADHLTQQMNEPYLTSVGVITIGASIGAATSEPGLSGNRLLAKADRSMYEVKRSTSALRNHRG